MVSRSLPAVFGKAFLKMPVADAGLQTMKRVGSISLVIASDQDLEHLLTIGE